MDVTTAAENGYTLVRPAGELTPADGGVLRDALLRAAAEQPPALVCDLRDLSGDCPALTFLVAVANAVQRWPGCPFVLISGSPRVLELLGGLGLTRRLRVLPDLAGVPAALAESPTPHRCHRQLPADRRSPGRARMMVSAALTAWHCAEHLGDVELVADELVANAVSHANSEIELFLSLRGPLLALAVADHSPRPLERRPRPADDEGGRGLVLVDALCDRWGTLPRADHGKIVWASFHV